MNLLRLNKICLIWVLAVVGMVVPAQGQINTNRVMATGKNALYFEDYVLAIQYFNQVIRAKPYLAEPYLYRALAKLSLDDYKGAESDFTLCTERNPFLVYAYQYRGAARQSQGNFEGAIADYDKGLEFRPEDRNMLLNKSIAYMQSKKYEEALASLSILLRYQPKFLYAYLTRGAVHIEKGDTVQALNDYNQAISIDKHAAPAYAQRAMLYLQKEDYALAVKDFDQAIHLETKQPGYHINRGLARYYLNDLRGAMADYDMVIRMDANNRIARFNRGLLRSQVGDVFGAVEDFNKVVEQEPDNYMAIYNRAILNEEAQQYPEAVADLDRVAAEYPNFVPAYYFRSEIKRKMGDIRGADTDYWYAYNLEQDLRKQRDAGKIVTGKGTYEASEADETGEEGGKTRENSDKDIAKFNRLVVYDKEEEMQSKYRNEIRGRVQDRQVKVDLEPQFVLTYYENMQALDNTTFRSDRMIADYNRLQRLPLQLRIVNHEAALTDGQAAYHFQSIDDHSLTLDRNAEAADAYFGRALDFMVLQDLSESLDDYGHTIELNPDFAPAYFNRAVVRYKLMEISDYREDNSGAGLSYNLETTRGKPSLLTPPGGVYRGPTAKENPQQEMSNVKRSFEYNLILRDYETVIQLNPDFVYAWFNRANIRCLQKEYRAAIADYNEAIRRNPDFAEAWFNRGLTRLYLGDTSLGIEDLSKAGELGLVDAYSIIKKMTEN
jgi:tetratricopeptide (TPR) repeat protein